MTSDLTTGIVRILKPNGETSGTGFVLTDDGLVATCAHVVESTGAGPGDIVHLIFHHTGAETTAYVEPEDWREPEAEDVAILRLQSELPAGIMPVSLGPSTNVAEHSFRAFGYPEVGNVQGVWAEGKILGLVTDSQGTKMLQLDSPQVAQGMSGGPVLNTDSGRVVGMVTATYHPDETLKFRDTAFATPVEILREVWPALPGPDPSRLPFEPELILIPAGTFTMGTDEGQPYEKPAHTVTLPDYRIGLFPITNGEFAAFIEGTGKVVPSLGWPGQRPAPEQELLPVTGVTWYLALEYCTWLSHESGQTYALPTEAEWEKAARGPDSRRYPWSDTWQEGRANNDPAQLAPVNHYPAQSIYGCYDMVGNAREWTCSLWGRQPRRPDARFVYPQTPDQVDQTWRSNSPRHKLEANSQMRRIYRGGADPTVEHLPCTLRRANMPDTKLDLYRHGLRVVLRQT